MRGLAQQHRERGFTLLEMMISVAILAVLAAIGVPYYRASVDRARVTRAKEELRIIAEAIDVFRTRDSDVKLPVTLEEVGYGNKLDPWGSPYMYLNFEAGTGNGMQYALENDLIDPAAAAGGGGPPGGGPPGGGAPPVAPSAAEIASAKTLGFKVPQGDAVGWWRNFRAFQANRSSASQKTKRKDKFLFPINTDYDLFSLGPNGKSQPELTGKLSLDDVIRANNGAFYGQAKDY
ncbi:MAG: prepilin-type N-terminal cleavage/methylation domain-containing protein [Planctomycetes bacterium]|nr:prepilin-type N-terminal cleavage/methylation domain-containing protein [Planctomycetota bacterium]